MPFCFVARRYVTPCLQYWKVHIASPAVTLRHQSGLVTIDDIHRNRE
jgi:hypothetical protein